jgi:AcrR family transcriptional regulator
VKDATGADAMTTADRIIEATLGLMVERGLSGVTMTAVAEAAGVARQTLYNHFSDVEGIVVAAIEAHQHESLAALRAVLATIDSPTARLEHLVRHVAAGAVHHHPVPAVHHGLSAAVRGSLLAYDRALLSIIADTLRAGLAAGELRPDVDAARDARLIQRMLDGVTELVSENPAAVGDVVATSTRTLLASVAASAPCAAPARPTQVDP